MAPTTWRWQLRCATLGMLMELLAMQQRNASSRSERFASKRPTISLPHMEVARTLGILALLTALLDQRQDKLVIRGRCDTDTATLV
jgi:hypothetical protein